MIDAHLHLIAPSRFDYPWLAGAEALRAPDLEATCALPQAAPIAGSLAVEADVAEPAREAEARWLCALAGEARNGLFGVIASVRPERDDFAVQLANIAHPRLVGVRRVLHVVDDGVSRSRTFRANIAALSDHGLTFDLCLRSDQLDLGLALVHAAPATRFVLDHGGNPPVADPSRLASWRAQVAALAAHADVFCKVSGLVNHVPPGVDTVACLQPIVAHLASVFGWQRLMFGSDWPVSTLAGFDQAGWIEVVRRLLPEEQAIHHAVFAENARRAYGLPKP